MYDVKRGMTSIRWCAAAVALASAAGGWGQSQFWGELKPGRYPVGFRSLYQLDIARSYDADYPAPGSTPRKKPRPIFLAIWYPAAALHDNAMVYRDYFRAVSADSRGRRFRPAPAQVHPRHGLPSTCSARSSRSSPTRSAPIGTRCSPRRSSPPRTCPPAAGKFPVVIYHPGLGGTFEDNAVACEYLASHGYVVVSSAYQAADSSSLNIDGDLATSFDDLQFPAALRRHSALCRQLQGRRHGPQLWRTGHARLAGASQFARSTPSSSSIPPWSIARWTNPPPSRRRWSTIAIPRCPSLMFADSRRQPRFEVFDPYLAYAARYEVTVDGMEHNDFVSQGAIGKDDAVHRNYEAICVVISAIPRRVPERRRAGAGMRCAIPAEGGLLQLRYKAPRPVPPTSAQIARLYVSEGPSNMQALVRAGEERRTRPADRCGGPVVRSGPQARSRRPADLGRAHSAEIGAASRGARRSAGGNGRQGRRARGLRAALALLPEDVTLDAGQKARTRNAIEEGLKALRK